VGFRNRYDGIDEDASYIIRRKARELIGKYGFTRSDRDDLEQELVLELLIRLPKYDPTRSKRNTFIKRIVNNKIATIIETKRAGKRDYRRCRLSLNDDVNGDDGEPIERYATIDQDEYLLRIGKRGRPVSEQSELKIDIEGFIASLPPGLRDLCDLLKLDNVSVVARLLKIPRFTIYDRITHLRKRFESQGLPKYLQRFPTHHDGSR